MCIANWIKIKAPSVNWYNPGCDPQLNHQMIVSQTPLKSSAANIAVVLQEAPKSFAE